MKLKFMALFLLTFLTACTNPILAPDYTVDKHFIAVSRAELINAGIWHHKVKTAGPSVGYASTKAMIANAASMYQIKDAPASSAQTDFKIAMLNCFDAYSMEYSVYITGTIFDLPVAEARTLAVCQVATDQLNDDMLRVGVAVAQ